MQPAPVMFNGKFLSARPTGVHRVAGQLITSLDRLLAERRQPTCRDWSVICPKDAREPLPLQAVSRRRAGRTTWQVWEQFELPGLARDGVLVNLCNMAPLAHRRSITLIHDAQVFLTPGSYPPAFLTWYQFALPRIGAAAARVITVSGYSRDRLVEFGVAPREKISVIHNGVDHFADVAADPALLPRLGLRPGKFVLATAGAQKHKNLSVVFEAFESPALGDLDLVVAGPDGAEAFLASGMKPPLRTKFAGRVTDGELKALYEGAACLAFPSTTEGFGLPPLEAMSLKCPAVVAPCGALPEVCGDAALYVEPHDPAAWARAFRMCVDDGDLRTRMVKAGVDQAARYRWDDSAGQLLEIIEGLA